MILFSFLLLLFYLISSIYCKNFSVSRVNSLHLGEKKKWKSRSIGLLCKAVTRPNLGILKIINSTAGPTVTTGINQLIGNGYKKQGALSEVYSIALYRPHIWNAERNPGTRKQRDGWKRGWKGADKKPGSYWKAGRHNLQQNAEKPRAQPC